MGPSRKPKRTNGEAVPRSRTKRSGPVVGSLAAGFRFGELTPYLRRERWLSAAIHDDALVGSLVVPVTPDIGMPDHGVIAV